MFGLHSNRKRKAILLTCPVCGGEQQEPALAISTYCRKCGSHYRIEDGEAVMPPGAQVSGLSPIFSDEASIEPEEKSAEPKSTEKLELGAQAQKLEKDPESGRGVGQTWMDEDAERSDSGGGKKRRKPGSNRSRKKKRRGNRAQETAPAGDSDSEKKKDEAESETGDRDLHLGEGAQPKEALKEGSMSAMFGTVIEKTPSKEAEIDEGFHPRMPQSFRAEPAKKKHKTGPATRDVRCFECNHQQKVSIAASSTQCARCSVYIGLVDHDITTPWSQNIRTRGNVHVRKRGVVSGCDVACHDLEVDGRLSATVDCSGSAVFRHSARIMGHMHCKHLVIEKKTEVIFPQGVWAESVEVYGTIVGNVTCAGTIRIHKNARVEGDARARAVDLKDGGELSGRMSIQSDLDITPPEKEGYLRTF